jgi:hypothetical protein
VNPWELDATGLMVWGLVAHLIADWPLQNDWMANNKATNLGANLVHSGIHLWALLFVFGWVAVPLAVLHGLIDTRKPVVWWSRLVRQTQPSGRLVEPYDGKYPPVTSVWRSASGPIRSSTSPASLRLLSSSPPKDPVCLSCPPN